MDGPLHRVQLSLTTMMKSEYSSPEEANKRINMDKEDPEKASPKFPTSINLCAFIFITSAILLTIVICEVVIHNESMDGKVKIRFW